MALDSATEFAAAGADNGAVDCTDAGTDAAGWFVGGAEASGDGAPLGVGASAPLGIGDGAPLGVCGGETGAAGVRSGAAGSIGAVSGRSPRGVGTVGAPSDDGNAPGALDAVGVSDAARAGGPRRSPGSARAVGGGGALALGETSALRPPASGEPVSVGACDAGFGGEIDGGGDGGFDAGGPGRTVGSGGLGFARSDERCSASSARNVSASSLGGRRVAMPRLLPWLRVAT